MPMPSFSARKIALAALDDRVALRSLSSDALGIGGRQIDLVDHRNDRQVLLEREVVVGERLRFDALGRVDDEQCALAGTPASARPPKKSRRDRAYR